MSSAVANAACFVDIYPYEGGQYSIQGGQILSCTVSKNIREDAGRFEIVLAPGGPFGTSSAPYWPDVLTPSSLVIIGMQRGAQRQVVMVGILCRIATDEMWQHGAAVRRVMIISGEDFAYFFRHFNWSSLIYRAVTAGTGIAVGTGFPPGLADSVLHGPPNEVATNLYQRNMAGANGVLANTQVTYRGQSVAFTVAMASYFQAYNKGVIPFGDFFLGAEESWLSKFRNLLTWPWYEFFVTTAPPNVYPGISGGFAFSVKGLGANVTAVPAVIGRVNPLPVLSATGTPQSASFGQIDTSLWQSLPRVVPDMNYIEQRAEFCDDEVRNFYTLDPTNIRGMFGYSNNNLDPFVFLYNSAINIASVHRYGYRPAQQTTHYWTDITGAIAASAGQANPYQLTADMVSRVTSYHEPAPFMMRSTVRYPLQPQIFPGCRFQYTPEKGSVTWDFYIEGVTHEFEFGGRSTTTLMLSRGLPTSIYDGSGGNTLLTQIHKGNAQRKDGTYQVGLPSAAGAADTLKFFNVNGIPQVLGQIAQVYVQPQGR